MIEDDKYYEEDTKFFKSMSKQSRAQWIQELFKRVPQQRQFKIFKVDYPHSSKWEFKNYKMHYQYYKCKKTTPKALLFYFHGFNSHGGQSGYTMIQLAKKLQSDAYAIDYINFGQSEGPLKGYFESITQLVIQAEQFIEFIKSQYQNSQKLKIFIVGLSLGGLVCLHLGIKCSKLISGCIFLSPAFRQNFNQSKFSKIMLKLTQKIIPKVKLLAQGWNSCTRVSQGNRVLSDPYMYTDKMMPGSVATLFQSMDTAQKYFKQFTLPFILIQSGVDKVVDPFVAIDFEQQCQSSDKKVIYFKNMWHSITLQQEIQQIVPILASWIEERYQFKQNKYNKIQVANI